MVRERYVSFQVLHLGNNGVEVCAGGGGGGGSEDVHTSNIVGDKLKWDFPSIGQ